MKYKDVVLAAITFFFIGLTTLQSQTIKDIDGNEYKTVTIGGQVWMVQNLKTTKYNDGNSIPFVSDETAWSSITIPAYCWYGNNESSNKNTYGALYNWYAVKTDKLCPSGWHVPSDEEWTTLFTYLGGKFNIVGKIAETGKSNWSYPIKGATNSSGFTARPGGYRSGYSGSFSGVGQWAYWWTSTETLGAWAININDSYSSIMSDFYNADYGYSVRCLKTY